MSESLGRFTLNTARRVRTTSGRGKPADIDEALVACDRVIELDPSAKGAPEPGSRESRSIAPESVEEHAACRLAVGVPPPLDRVHVPGGAGREDHR